MLSEPHFSQCEQVLLQLHLSSNQLHSLQYSLLSANHVLLIYPHIQSVLKQHLPSGYSLVALGHFDSEKHVYDEH